MLKKSLLSVVLSGTLLLSLAACSAGSSDWDWPSIQKAIASDYYKQTGTRVTVQCDARPVLKQGDSVDCMMNVPGQKTPTDVTVKAEDNQGAYMWRTNG